MIKSVIEMDSFVGIPILDSDEYCYLLWEENETAIDCFRRFDRSMEIPEKGNPMNMHRWNHIYYEMNDDSDEEKSLIIYDINCIKTGIKYFLVCESEIGDYSDIFHCVCLPFNAINIIIFYNKYFKEIK